MIVVADATPLQYLVRIKAIDVLPPLNRRVLIPQSVAGELQQNNTPATVRAWIAQPPAWCEIRPDPPADPKLGFLDAGERAAIALCESLGADRLLMDERKGRARKPNAGICRSPAHWASWRMRMWRVCSISRRPSSNSGKPTSM